MRRDIIAEDQTVTGFKNEKELWEWQKPRLKGKWDRYELMTPAGHPDVKGSYHFSIYYIENKVGDYTTQEQRRAAMEPTQIEYMDWLQDCYSTANKVYVCFGSKKIKAARWYMWPDLDSMCAPPPGWTQK